MKKEVYFPWDKVPDEIYHAELTDHEHGVLEDAMDQVVKNVFKREKNPLKRTALMAEISRIAAGKVVRAAASEETKRKMNYHKKENHKMVKKMREKKKKSKEK